MTHCQSLNVEMWQHAIEKSCPIDARQQQHWERLTQNTSQISVPTVFYRFALFLPVPHRVLHALLASLGDFCSRFHSPESSSECPKTLGDLLALLAALQPVLLPHKATARKMTASGPWPALLASWRRLARSWAATLRPAARATRAPRATRAASASSAGPRRLLVTLTLVSMPQAIAQMVALAEAQMEAAEGAGRGRELRVRNADMSVCVCVCVCAPHRQLRAHSSQRLTALHLTCSLFIGCLFRSR
jgi:hypothetical protein